MRMFVDVRSNKGAVLSAIHRGQIDALTAMAQPVANEVKRSLRHGYRSSLGNWGDFVTGNNVNHVRVSPVTVTDTGASIRVGTDLDYALFWEVGHHNIFTRHFERDEKWAPAYAATRDEAAAAFARVFRSAFTGSSSFGVANDVAQSISFGSGEGADIE